MDLAIYEGVLLEAGIDPKAYDKKKQRLYTNGERTFRHDIFKGKTIWTGDRCFDFALFVASNHVMVGLFVSPKFHPYTARKRFITLSMILIVGAMSAAWSARFDQVSRTLHRYGMKLLVSVCNGVILFLMELMLKCCLSCPCRENVESEWCNNCCKCVSKSVVYFWLLVTAAALITMLVLVIRFQILETFLVIFCIQFITSWTLQCVGLYLKFRKGWKKDTQAMLQLQEQAGGYAALQEKRYNSYKELLPLKKELKFPYYVTYVESNEWMERTNFVYECCGCKRNCCPCLEKTKAPSTSMGVALMDRYDEQFQRLDSSMTELSVQETSVGNAYDD